MAAVQRGRKAYLLRKRRQQRRSRKILGRRRKPYSRRGKKAKTKRIMRFARSHYQKRRLPKSRYFNRRMKANALSSRKAKRNLSSYRNRPYPRKASRVGRLRKRKEYTRRRLGNLQAKLKKRASKKRAVERKVKRRTRPTDDEIFYSLVSSSMAKAPSEERQMKKHSVCFSNPGSSKTKETEPQEDVSVDNQSNQQTVPPKKRSRNSANPICKSR